MFTAFIVSIPESAREKITTVERESLEFDATDAEQALTIAREHFGVLPESQRVAVARIC